jgi:hypothetical protein
MRRAGLSLSDVSSQKMRTMNTGDHMVHRVVLLCAIATLALGIDASAVDGKLSAYLFGDYAYVAKSNDADLDGKSGFVVRRIYFTYDNNIAERFSARLRMEMSQGNFSKGAAKMSPVVKDAYLKWKLDRHSLYFGLSGTPTWGVTEKFWGYRWLEMTPLDLHKYGSSRDVGLAVKGTLDADKKIGYHLMLGQGNSNKSESDKGKKAYCALVYKPSRTALFEIYGDYEDSEGDESNTASYILQGFAGFSGDFGRVGLQYAYSSAEETDSTEVTQNIISAFVVAKLSEKAKAVARVDYLTDPNPNAAKISYFPMVPTAENLVFAVAGVDFEAAKNVHFQPNIEIVSYGNDPSTGDKPDAEIIPRFTVFFKF